MKREYELLILFRILSSEDESRAAIDQVVTYIEDGGYGKVTKVDKTSLGRRRLEYEIDKQRDGLYVLIWADIDTLHLPELQLNLKLFNPVLRFLITEGNDEMPAESRPPRPPRPARFGNRSRNNDDDESDSD